MERRQDRAHPPEGDERVPIRFTPAFQERTDDLRWERKDFVGPLPGFLHDLLESPPSASRTRWRFTILTLMIAVALVAVLIAGGLWSLGQLPRARECRRMAAIHARSAREWTDYAQLSDKGITSIITNVFGQHILDFNHYVQPQRPTQPKAAEEFDRECSRIAAICRARAEYHSQMSQKWLRGYRFPWQAVLPDPSPPFPIEPSDIRDAIY